MRSAFSSVRETRPQACISSTRARPLSPCALGQANQSSPSRPPRDRSSDSPPSSARSDIPSPPSPTPAPSSASSPATTTPPSCKPIRSCPSRFCGYSPPRSTPPATPCFTANFWSLFTEAIRTGLEIGAEIVFADPDAGHRPHLKDAYPDPYAVRHIGLARYVEAYRVYPQPRSDELARHAAGIAWKLQGANPFANVLVVISLNLLDPVLDAMEEPRAQPLMRTRREGIELVNPHPESLAEILLESPALQWRYETFRGLMTDANLIDRRII